MYKFKDMFGMAGTLETDDEETRARKALGFKGSGLFKAGEGGVHRMQHMIGQGPGEELPGKVSVWEGYEGASTEANLAESEDEHGNKFTILRAGDRVRVHDPAHLVGSEYTVEEPLLDEEGNPVLEPVLDEEGNQAWEESYDENGEALYDAEGYAVMTESMQPVMTQGEPRVVTRVQTIYVVSPLLDPENRPLCATIVPFDRGYELPAAEGVRLYKLPSRPAGISGVMNKKEKFMRSKGYAKSQRALAAKSEQLADKLGMLADRFGGDESRMGKGILKAATFFSRQSNKARARQERAEENRQRHVDAQVKAAKAKENEAKQKAAELVAEKEAAQAWKTEIDDDTGKEYYWNEVTGETTFTKPLELVALESGALDTKIQMAEAAQQGAMAEQAIARGEKPTAGGAAGIKTAEAGKHAAALGEGAAKVMGKLEAAKLAAVVKNFRRLAGTKVSVFRVLPPEEYRE